MKTASRIWAMVMFPTEAVPVTLPAPTLTYHRMCDVRYQFSPPMSMFRRPPWTSWFVRLVNEYRHASSKAPQSPFFQSKSFRGLTNVNVPLYGS